MGRHASAEGRTRIAAWPIFALVAVLVVAALAVGYFLILRSSQKSAACSGSTLLPVAASTGAAAAVADAAVAFNATTPVARSTCVTVTVAAVPNPVAEAALAAGWKGLQTRPPGMWVVDSLPDLAALDASDSAMTAGHGTGALATSPVVLAVRTAPTTTPVSWEAVAAGTAPTGTLAIPPPAGNRASSYALESIVAADQATTTVDAAAVTASTSVFKRLAAAVPSPPKSTAEALAELSAGSADYTAVPVVESDLARFNAVHHPGLTAVYPSGPTAGDDVMAVPLTASWVTAAMSDAAAAFDAFLSGPTGTAIFNADHLRTDSPPKQAVGVDLNTPVTKLPAAGVLARTLTDAAWAASLTAAAGSTSTSLVSTTPDPTATDAAGTASGLPAPASAPSSGPG